MKTIDQSAYQEWQYIRSEANDTEDNPRAHVVRARGWIVDGIDGGGEVGNFKFEHHLIITPREDYKNSQVTWKHGEDEYKSSIAIVDDRSAGVQFHFGKIDDEKIKDTIARAMENKEEIELKVIAINMPPSRAALEIMGWSEEEADARFYAGLLDHSNFMENHEVYRKLKIGDQNCVSVERIISINAIKKRNIFQKALSLFN